MLEQTTRSVRSRASFSFSDLAKLGFRHADRGVEEAGQPPHDLADLLKLYLYGYINQVKIVAPAGTGSVPQSGTYLATEELAAGLSDHRQFPQGELAGAEGFKSAASYCWPGKLGLVGGSVVAIHGSFFHGDASKASIFTRKRLTGADCKGLTRRSRLCRKSLEDNDAAEAKEPTKDRSGGDGGGDSGDIGAKVAALMAKRSRAQDDLDRLEESGETQLSLTDPDARLRSQERSGHRRLQCAGRRRRQA